MAEDTVALLMEGTQRLKDTLGRKFSVAKLMGVLADYPCPARCIDELSHSHYRDIDPYYSVRHGFLQRLLVDELRLRLGREGFLVKLVAENDLPFGHGDLDVVVIDPNAVVWFNGFSIRLELKGGATFDIGQLVRYHLDVDAIVVALAKRGMALTVKTKDVKELVEFATGVYARKLDTLAEDGKEKVPGPWCRGCLVKCPYQLEEQKHLVNFETEFTHQTAEWVRCMKDACDKIVGLLEEVRVSGPEVGPGTPAHNLPT